MAVVKTLLVQLEAQTSGLEKGVDRAKNKLKGLGDAAKKAGGEVALPFGLTGEGLKIGDTVFKLGAAIFTAKAALQGLVGGIQAVKGNWMGMIDAIQQMPLVKEFVPVTNQLLDLLSPPAKDNRPDAEWNGEATKARLRLLAQEQENATAAELVGKSGFDLERIQAEHERRAAAQRVEADYQVCRDAVYRNDTLKQIELKHSKVMLDIRAREAEARKREFQNSLKPGQDLLKNLDRQTNEAIFAASGGKKGMSGEQYQALDAQQAALEAMSQAAMRFAGSGSIIDLQNLQQAANVLQGIEKAMDRLKEKRLLAEDTQKANDLKRALETPAQQFAREAEELGRLAKKELIDQPTLAAGLKAAWDRAQGPMFVPQSGAFQTVNAGLIDAKAAGVDTAAKSAQQILMQQQLDELKKTNQNLRDILAEGGLG